MFPQILLSLCIVYCCQTQVVVGVTIDNITYFPIDENEYLNLTFTFNSNESSRNNKVWIVIETCQGKVLDKFALNLKTKTRSSMKIDAEYIRKIVMINKNKDNKIEINFLFTKLADKNVFGIYKWRKIEFSNMTQFNASDELYKGNIILIGKQDIDVVTDNYFSKNEQYLKIICKVENRFVVPVISGLIGCRISSHRFYYDNETIATTEIILNVYMKDHGKIAHCATSRSSVKKFFRINVLHHPSSVVIKTNDSVLLVNNKPLKCMNVGGYPEPIIIWNVFSNDNKYIKIKNQYTVTENEVWARDLLLENAPNWSFWTFKCIIISKTDTIQRKEAIWTVIVKPSNMATVGTEELLRINVALITEIMEIKPKLMKESKKYCPQIKDMGNYCYKFYKNVETYIDARSRCREENGSLAQVDSSIKVEYLNSILNDLTSKQVYIYSKYYNNYRNYPYSYHSDRYNRCTILTDRTTKEVNCKTKAQYVCQFENIK